MASTINYSKPTVSGYNASPPPDDDSTGSNNQVSWAKHKNKIGDPLLNYINAINNEVQTTFAEAKADINGILDAAPLLDMTVLTAGSGVHYWNSKTKSARVILVGGGGGSGGTPSIGPGTNAATGGGGAGGVSTLFIADVSAVSASPAYTVGAAGTAGAAGGDGGDGGDTTWDDGTNAVTAGGGAGSVAGNFSGSTIAVCGGAAGGTATGGTLNIPGGNGSCGYCGLGAPSGNGWRVAGDGGSNSYAPSARGLEGASQTVGAVPGEGYGGGGSGQTGSNTVNNNVAGSAGAAGAVIIYEYGSA